MKSKSPVVYTICRRITTNAVRQFVGTTETRRCDLVILCASRGGGVGITAVFQEDYHGRVGEYTILLYVLWKTLYCCIRTLIFSLIGLLVGRLLPNRSSWMYIDYYMPNNRAYSGRGRISRNQSRGDGGKGWKLCGGWVSRTVYILSSLRAQYKCEIPRSTDYGYYTIHNNIIRSLLAGELRDRLHFASHRVTWPTVPGSPSLLIHRSTFSGRRRYRRRPAGCCRPRRPAPIRRRGLLLRPRATNRFSCNTSHYYIL